MSFHKASAVTLLALSIVACSNNDHHRSAAKPTVTPTVPAKTDSQEQAEAKKKAEAEAKAKAEAERKAKEEAAKKAAEEKARQEAKAKAEAEAKRLAEEKRKAEEAAKKAAEEKARQEAEAKRLAEEKARRAAKIEDLTKKATDAGLSAEQIANYANDNVDKSDAEAKAVLGQLIAKQARVTDLMTIATKAGLNEDDARKLAEGNADDSDVQFQMKIEQWKVDSALQEAKSLKGVYAFNTENKLVEQSGSSAVSTRNRLTNASRNHKIIYNQPYSVVVGAYNGDVSYNNETGHIFSDSRSINFEIRGLKTKEEDLPAIGSATYTGLAFNGTIGMKRVEKQENLFGSTYTSYDYIDEVIGGKLSYTVNFDNKTGSGSITGLGDVIHLSNGSIVGTGISSTANQSYKTGNYYLNFYGLKAEEIAGKVSLDGKDIIGFGGTRGEIKK